MLASPGHLWKEEVQGDSAGSALPLHTIPMALGTWGDVTHRVLQGQGRHSWVSDTQVIYSAEFAMASQ